MSFKPYTENIKKKKIEICSILGRIRIRIQNRTRIWIHHPGSGSADTDPKHRLIFYTFDVIDILYVLIMLRTQSH